MRRCSSAASRAIRRGAGPRWSRCSTRSIGHGRRPKKSEAVGAGNRRSASFAFVAIFVVMNLVSHTSQPSCSGARALAPVYSEGPAREAAQPSTRGARSSSTAGRTSGPTHTTGTARSPTTRTTPPQALPRGAARPASTCSSIRKADAARSPNADLAIDAAGSRGLRARAARDRSAAAEGSRAARASVQELRTLPDRAARGDCSETRPPTPRPARDARTRRSLRPRALDNSSVRAEAMGRVKLVLVATTARNSRRIRTRARPTSINLMKRGRRVSPRPPASDRSARPAPVGMLEMAAFTLACGASSTICCSAARPAWSTSRIRSPSSCSNGDRAEIANVARPVDRGDRRLRARPPGLARARLDRGVRAVHDDARRRRCSTATRPAMSIARSSRCARLSDATSSSPATHSGAWSSRATRWPRRSARPINRRTRSSSTRATTGATDGWHGSSTITSAGLELPSLADETSRRASAARTACPRSAVTSGKD